MVEFFCDFENCNYSSYFTITYTLFFMTLLFCFKVPRSLTHFKLIFVYGVKRLKNTKLIICILVCSITEASQFFIPFTHSITHGIPFK